MLFAWIFCTPPIIFAFPYNTNLDSIYNEHKQVIISKADSIANYLSDSITSRYHVPYSKVNQLYHFLRKREILKTCYDYSGLSYESCLLRKKIVDEEYQDSVYSILILSPSNKLSGNNISFVLLYQKQLKLSNVQYNELISEALKSIKMIHLNSDKELWELEMSAIHDILDGSQWDEFFRIKNESSVLFQMNRIFNKIGNQRWGEVSQDIIAQIYAYLHERQKIIDIFRFRKKEQNKALKNLQGRFQELSDIIEPIFNANSN